MKIRTLFDTESEELFVCATDIEYVLGVSKLNCRKLMFNQPDTMGRLRNMAYLDMQTLQVVLNRYSDSAPAGVVDQLKDSFQL
jgi:hypothetical protein